MIQTSAVRNALVQDEPTKVQTPGDLVRRAHRRVNGKDADKIPDVVISAIATYYGSGGHPIHWDREVGAYVMETPLHHVEVSASKQYATVRFWPSGYRINYRQNDPTSIRHFALEVARR